MFGVGNIMYRRYPNGPKEYQTMKVPIYQRTSNSRSTGTSNSRNTGTSNSRNTGTTGIVDSPQYTPTQYNTNQLTYTQQDGSWMFEKGANHRVYRRSEMY
ncbi:hypothetical protein Pmani_011817 [Petrolisthes manimaculis]|uniref:Uncharacterized protein n=1 Tax=Petrolisthes manimaculis TaxID=1843537 RepID=A0AAE1Q251_9EUCA|nr:hypothetical protein Pmani_011817 [Petrolisthes manimaculis]